MSKDETPKTYEISSQQLQAVYNALSVSKEGIVQAGKLIQDDGQRRYFEDDRPVSLDAAEYILDRITEQLAGLESQLPSVEWAVPF